MEFSRLENIDLDAHGIDAISSTVLSDLNKLKVENKTATKIRIYIETLLTDLLEKKEHKRVSYKIEKKAGTYFAVLIIEGSEINPISSYGEYDHTYSEFYSSILSRLQLEPTFSYKRGCNYISFFVNKKKINPAIPIFSALFLGLFIGLMLNRFAPEFAVKLDNFTTPISSTILGVLKSMSCYMILFSIISSIIRMGNVTNLGREGKTVLTRILLYSLIISTVSTLAFTFIESTKFASGSVNSENSSEILSMVLSIVPSDLLSSFLNGNAMQVVMVAIVMGVAILSSIKNDSPVYRVVDDLNIVFDWCIKLVLEAIPVYVFCSSINLVIGADFSVLKSSWKLAAFFILLCFIGILLFIFIDSAKMKRKPYEIIKDLFPAFIIGLTTASSSAAYDAMINGVSNKLHVEKKFANVWTPISMVMYMPANIIKYTITAVFLAHYCGIDITFTWVVMCILASSVLGIATPPIAGGSIACYTILLGQLGIPQSAVAIAIAIDTILDFPGTGINVVSNELFVSSCYRKVNQNK